MLLLMVVLLLAAFPDESLGEDEDEDADDEDGVEGEDDEMLKGVALSQKDQETIVDKHNEIRRNVKPTAANMLKMVWNSTIAESAMKWARECKLEISLKNDRTYDGVMCSENIFYTNFHSDWIYAIEQWEKRKSHFKYSYGAVDPSRSIVSYTQLIWYNSYQIGCGLAYCPGDISFFFYVCQYCPAANRKDQLARPYKKGKPCQACRNSCENKLCTNPCKYRDNLRDCRDLKELYGCKRALLKRQCKATCKCKTEIV